MILQDSKCFSQDTTCGAEDVGRLRPQHWGLCAKGVQVRGGWLWVQPFGYEIGEGSSEALTMMFRLAGHRPFDTFLHKRGKTQSRKADSLGLLIHLSPQFCTLETRNPKSYQAALSAWLDMII